MDNHTKELGQAIVQGMQEEKDRYNRRFTIIGAFLMILKTVISLYVLGWIIYGVFCVVTYLIELALKFMFRLPGLIIKFMFRLPGLIIGLPGFIIYIIKEIKEFRRTMEMMDRPPGLGTLVLYPTGYEKCKRTVIKKTIPICYEKCTRTNGLTLIQKT